MNLSDISSHEYFFVSEFSRKRSRIVKFHKCHIRPLQTYFKQSKTPKIMSPKTQNGETFLGQKFQLKWTSQNVVKRFHLRGLLLGSVFIKLVIVKSQLATEIE